MRVSTKKALQGTQSLVDPELELLDPTPDIFELFTQFDTEFFDGCLACCELKWSPRMTTCAGVCSYQGKGGLCSIRLSRPLLTLRPRKDLIETLLHEMIHAFLFLTSRITDRDGHGPEFQYHMHRINKTAGTQISIYHSFHDEVRLYKTHWWKCNGPCRNWRPYYGEVKRAANRAPGPNDLWWEEHQRKCGGTFVKIKEPEGYGVKKAKKRGYKAEVDPPNDPKQKKIEAFFDSPSKPGPSKAPEEVSQSRNTQTQPSTIAFSGIGRRLGTNSPKTSPAKGFQPSISQYFPLSSSSSTVLGPFRTFEKIILEKGLQRKVPGEDEVVLIGETPASAACPVCTTRVPLKDMNSHLDVCLT